MKRIKTYHTNQPYRKFEQWMLDDGRAVTIQHIDGIPHISAYVVPTGGGDSAVVSLDELVELVRLFRTVYPGVMPTQGVGYVEKALSA